MISAFRFAKVRQRPPRIRGTKWGTIRSRGGVRPKPPVLEQWDGVKRCSNSGGKTHDKALQDVRSRWPVSSNQSRSLLSLRRATLTLQLAKKWLPELTPSRSAKPKRRAGSGKSKNENVRPRTVSRRRLASGGTGGQLANLRVMPITSCDASKRTFSHC